MKLSDLQELFYAARIGEPVQSPNDILRRMQELVRDADTNGVTYEYSEHIEQEFMAALVAVMGKFIVECSVARTSHNVKFPPRGGMERTGPPQKVMVPVSKSSDSRLAVYEESTVNPPQRKWDPEDIAMAEEAFEADEAMRLSFYPKHPETGRPIGYFDFEFDQEDPDDSEIQIYTGYEDDGADDCPPGEIDKEVERILLTAFQEDWIEVGAAESLHIVYTKSYKEDKSKIRQAFKAAGWKQMKH